MNYDIDINVCYSIVFEALAAGKGMQSITDALYAYTKMPIHVVDISFKVIAASFEKTTGTKHIDDNIKLGVVPPKVVIEDYYRLGYIEEAERHEKSSVVDWGVVEVPQATGAIRINGNMGGICATTFGDTALASIALEVNDILCKALAIEMEREQRVVGRATDPIHQVMARELFKDLLSKKEQKENTDFVDMRRLRPGYQIAVITPEVRNNARVQHIRNAILDIFPDAFYIIKGGYLYILFANLPKSDRDEYIVNTIGSLLKNYQCYCGMSGIFTDLSCRSGFRLRAQKALEIGQALHPDRNLHLFDEYYLEIMVSYAVKGLGKSGYWLPELERLRKEDMEKGDDYYNTLKTYLVLGNNISLTAAKLHIHRNTLTYRLSKIREITGLDINDQEVIRRLLLSMTMRYVDDSMHHRKAASSPEQMDFWATI